MEKSFDCLIKTGKRRTEVLKHSSNYKKNMEKIYAEMLKRKAPKGCKILHELLRKACWHYCKASVSTEIKLIECEYINKDDPEALTEAVDELIRVDKELKIGTDYIHKFGNRIR